MKAIVTIGSETAAPVARPTIADFAEATAVRPRVADYLELTKPRLPCELQARKKVAEALGGDAKRGMAEMTAIEDVENALRVIQHELKPSDKPHVWTIANGPGTTMQIWESK